MISTKILNRSGIFKILCQWIVLFSAISTASKFRGHVYYCLPSLHNAYAT